MVDLTNMGRNVAGIIMLLLHGSAVAHFISQNKIQSAVEHAEQNQMDFVDLGINSVESDNSESTGNSSNFIVEMALVCDKEFSDVFRHDRQKILDYWTVFLWDLAMRYRTLFSVTISFRITSVTVFDTFANQSFIENIRNSTDGTVSFYKILEPFGKWIWAQTSLPKFDLAMLALNTKMKEGLAGLAFQNTACAKNISVGVFKDSGVFGSVEVAAHEIGHILGANHDESTSGCSKSGFIMDGSGGVGDIRQFFFSNCTDGLISSFVRSSDAACLGRIDEPQSPSIAPGFNTVPAPSIVEQCRKRLNNSNAYVTDKDTGNCTMATCWIQQSAGHSSGIIFTPVDNSPCLGGGHCFRGRCLPRLSPLVNANTSWCLLGGSNFIGNDTSKLTPCPNVVTPLESFYLKNGTNQGKLLAMPYSSLEGIQNEDKCLFAIDQEGSSLQFDRCSAAGRSFEWDLSDDGSGAEYLITHQKTKMCAKQNASVAIGVVNCDIKNTEMLWKFY